MITMFFTIRFGANEEEIFNSDCSLDHLIDSIKRRCHFPSPSDFDLAVIDDQLSIIHVTGESSKNCAPSFKERATYTLLAVDRNELGNSKYIPLLDKIDPELTAKLEMASNPKSSADHFKLAKNSGKATRSSKIGGSSGGGHAATPAALKTKKKSKQM